MNLSYEGGLRVKAVHAPSGTSLVTDAPVDNHGRGESFSPTDLLSASLGACMATLMGIVAERHHIELKGMTIQVRKHMVTSPVRRVGKVEVLFKIPTVVDLQSRKMLEKAALTCPVHESLHPDIEKVFTFDWAD